MEVSPTTSLTLHYDIFTFNYKTKLAAYAKKPDGTIECIDSVVFNGEGRRIGNINIDPYQVLNDLNCNEVEFAFKVYVWECIDLSCGWHTSFDADYRWAYNNHPEINSNPLYQEWFKNGDPTRESGENPLQHPELYWPYVLPACYLFAPTNLSTTPTSYHSISLTWDDNTAYETGYEIWRRDSFPNPNPPPLYIIIPWRVIDSVGVNTHLYTDTDVEPQVNYWYKVRAYDNAGHYSQFSNVPHRILEDVKGFYTLPGDKELYLHWNNPNVNYFKEAMVVRGVDEIDWLPINDSVYNVGDEVSDSVFVVYKGGSNAFTDTGLVNYKNYFYHIFAIDTAGNYSKGLKAIGTPSPLVSDTLEGLLFNNGRKLICFKDTLMLTYTSNNKIHLAKSTDGGKTWSDNVLFDGIYSSLAGIDSTPGLDTSQWNGKTGEMFITWWNDQEVHCKWNSQPLGTGWSGFSSGASDFGYFDEVSHPSIMIDENDTGHIAFNAVKDGINYLYYSKFYCEDPGWDMWGISSPETVGIWPTSDALVRFRYPSIAVDEMGNPHIITQVGLWYKNPYLVDYHKDGGIWKCDTITDPLGSVHPSTFSSGGKIYLVYGEDHYARQVYLREYTVDSGWTSPETVSVDSVMGIDIFPEVVANGDNVFIVWESYRPGDSSFDIYYRERMNGVWSDIINISHSLATSKYPKVLYKSDSLYIVWMERDGAWSIITKRMYLYPEVSIHSPVNNSNLELGYTYTVSYHSEDNIGVDHHNIYYSLDNGADWIPVAENIIDTFYNWTTPETLADNVLLRVDAVDGEGNIGSDTISVNLGQFTADATALSYSNQRKVAVSGDTVHYVYTDGDSVFYAYYDGNYHKREFVGFGKNPAIVVDDNGVSVIWTKGNSVYYREKESKKI